MSVAVNELIESRPLTKGESNSGQTRYIIVGTTSETVAVTQLQAQAKATLDGMQQRNFSVEPVGDPLTTAMWFGTVTYGPSSNPKQRETGESTSSFDTSGGLQQISQSISTKSYGAGAKNYKGAINVSGEGSDIVVNGVDIVSPVYTFVETKYFPFNDVTYTYRGKLFYLTGTTNTATFKGCKKGECLFLGASGGVRGNDQDWEINFRFAASPEKLNMTIGDITGINKEGWEYIWTRYYKEDDDGEIIVTPKAVYVEQVYEYGDFSDLGIGT